MLLSPEARALYAEKHPDKTTRKPQGKQQLELTEGGGLVDVDALELEDGQAGPAGKQLAIQAGGSEGAPETSTAEKDALSLSLVPAAPPKVTETSIVPAGKRAGKVTETSIVPAKIDREDAKATPPKGLQKAFGKRAASRFSASMSDVPPAKKQRVDAPPPEAPAQLALTASVGGTGSVWEQCAALEVPPGTNGLLEARDSLEESLATRSQGGLNVIKAEKKAVCWMKGLLVCEVSATQLRETKLGIAVNEWRKHPEPYIAQLAMSLLTTWRKAWREAVSHERKPLPPTAAAKSPAALEDAGK